MRLTALDEKAEMLGLRKEQGVAEARAMYPDLDVIEEDKAADMRFLEAIADWCDRYTPLVALDGTDGLFLDITGCAHLFGGERAMLKDILSRLFHMGIDARGAVSASPNLSAALARFSFGGIVEDDEIEARLASLPIAALRLDADVVDALRKVGLKYIIDILEAPRAPLARRFGTRLLARLDQALGHDEEPISPRLPVASLSAERRLMEPIQAEEDILALAVQVAASLKPSLEARGLGGRVFELVLFRVDGRVFRISAGASQPLRDPPRIAKLFSERLIAVHDDLDAGYGFEILRLNVLQHEAFDALQADFEEGRQKEASLAAFIDRASARLGDGCLRSYQLRESHIPEHAFVATPAIEGFKAGSQRRGLDIGLFRGERPLRLLPVAEPVEALFVDAPEGPPQGFIWRRINHHVARSEGPERIEMEWWLNKEPDGKNAVARDYFRLEDDDGHRFWIYRQGFYEPQSSPRWFMHGLFA